MDAIDVQAEKPARPIQREVGFCEAVDKFWKGWTVKGRASRSEMIFAFWFHFFITTFVVQVSVILSTLEAWVDGDAQIMESLMPLGSALLCTCWVVSILPTIFISIRRLHDTGRSGWWLLLVLLVVPLPLVWWWLHLPSEPSTNRYGAIPNVVES